MDTPSGLTKDAFKPAWWLPGPHLQTLWAAFSPMPSLDARSERLELPDGDFLDLAWVGQGQNTPRVLIVHGLNGDLKTPYIQRILKAILDRGWRGVLMHFRGCSGVPNRLDRAYHSGETQDLQWVISTLIEREPKTPLFAIGYSLGGNVLLKWLGEQGSAAPLNAAAAVSVPFELSKTVDKLNQGFSKLYQWHLLQELRAKHRLKFKNRQAFQDDEVNQLKTFRDFDEAITAPLHGFKNSEDYYQRSSSRSFIRAIQKPTLIIHAENDPFTPPTAIPSHSELSNTVTLNLVKSGGHLGFIEGRWPWKPFYWLEPTVLRYLEEFQP